MQQVPTFPCTSNSVIKLFAVRERRQVLRDLLLEVRLESESFERGRVAERDGDPAGLVGAMAVVGEESSLSRDTLELFRTRGHVVEVRREEDVAVALRELESEASLLFERVLDSVDVVSPRESVVRERVVDCLVGRDREGNAVGGLGARESEAATGGGGGGVVDGVEVEVDLAVEVVDVDAAVAVELWDFEVRVRGEEVLERLVEGMKKRKELSGQDVLEDCEKPQKRPHLRQYLHLCLIWNYILLLFFLSLFNCEFVSVLRVLLMVSGFCLYIYRE